MGKDLQPIFATAAGNKALDDALYPPVTAKPLTTGETALVKSIFGDAIDLKNIKKYITIKDHPTAAAAIFGTETIKFYGVKNAEADYSKSKNFFLYGTFIHEIAHIWQNQTKAEHLFSATRLYEYALSPKSLFKDFTQEQQASLIQDYALQFFYHGRSCSKPTDQYLPLNASLSDSSSVRNLADLQKIVEDNFPETRKTRLALEAQKKTSPPPSLPLGERGG